MNGSFQSQLEEITKMSEGAGNTVLHTVCEYLKSHNTGYNWVGIYIIQGDKLKLNTFVGKPTEHTLIPITEGLCGQAIVRGAIVNEPDVKLNSSYLACSIETSSELVVPVWHNEKLLGEIDIDSDIKQAFTREDEVFVETVGKIISKHFLCDMNEQ